MLFKKCSKNDLCWNDTFCVSLLDILLIKSDECHCYK